MRDIQVSRPVLIALIGAVLVGGFLLFKQTQNSETAPPPPPPAQAAATGATGASEATGGTGASGETMTSAEARAKRAKEAREALIKQAKDAGIPFNVYEPLHQGKIVLIFFYTKGASDDQKVSQSIDEVAKKRGGSMKVIRETVERKSRYDGVAKAADITQTPGILILYGDEASTWQGFIDAVALNSRITQLTSGS